MGSTRLAYVHLEQFIIAEFYESNLCMHSKLQSIEQTKKSQFFFFYLSATTITYLVCSAAFMVYVLTYPPPSEDMFHSYYYTHYIFAFLCYFFSLLCSRLFTSTNKIKFNSSYINGIILIFFIRKFLLSLPIGMPQGFIIGLTLIFSSLFFILPYNICYMQSKKYSKQSLIHIIKLSTLLIIFETLCNISVGYFLIDIDYSAMNNYQKQKPSLIYFFNHIFIGLGFLLAIILFWYLFPKIQTKVNKFQTKHNILFFTIQIITTILGLPILLLFLIFA